MAFSVALSPFTSLRRPAPLQSAFLARPAQAQRRRPRAAQADRSSRAQPFFVAAAEGEASKGPLIAALATVAAVVVGVAASNPSGNAPTLKTLAERSVAIEAALGNGKPTVLEFYANWCDGCKAMVPDVLALEDKFGDKVNFVMLNVDSPQTFAEIDKYDVDGIPHFEFLSGAGKDLGHAIGKMPRAVIEANLNALAAERPLPYANAVGEQTAFE
eukprot:tig00001264_g7874.t1